MNDEQRREPIAIVRVGQTEVTLLGTAHVSQASADAVEEMLRGRNFQSVAVELCPSRYNAIVDPDALARMNLFQVFREGKAAMVMASLALGAFQQRTAEQLGIKPGAEMRAAIDTAREHQLPVLLIDREIGITLRRIYRNVPWWQRFNLLAGIIASVASRHQVSAAEIERLKEGDILESTFSQFAEEAGDLYQPLVDERDRYMAARIQQEAAQHGHPRMLAVVGAGHLKGIQRYLAATDVASAGSTLAQLDRIPPPARWPKVIPWLIVALILTGFAIGFTRSPDMGWQLVIDWILINGGLAALGAVMAGAHPLTIVTAFLAAPLTSLNPTIGVGMVTAPVETYVRKPTVGDFGSLRSDTAHLKGWWTNRVTRVLLVFLLTTLGSAIGTYVAGFRIIERLT